MSREGATLLKWSADTSLSYLTRNVQGISFVCVCFFVSSCCTASDICSVGVNEKSDEMWRLLANDIICFLWSYKWRKMVFSCGLDYTKQFVSEDIWQHVSSTGSTQGHQTKISIWSNLIDKNTSLTVNEPCCWLMTVTDVGRQFPKRRRRLVNLEEKCQISVFGVCTLMESV